MLKSKDNKLKGLKGWLSLVIVTLVLLFLSYFLTALVQIMNIILGEGGLSTVFWLIFFLVFSVLFGYCLNLGFKHKKEFPTWFIFSLWISSIIGLIISQTQESGFIATPFSFIWTILWTWYFIKSKRVKNTFVK